MFSSGLELVLRFQAADLRLRRLHLRREHNALSHRQLPEGDGSVVMMRRVAPIIYVTYADIYRQYCENE